MTARPEELSGKGLHIQRIYESILPRVSTDALRAELERRRQITIHEVTQRLQRDQEIPLLDREDVDLEPKGAEKKKMVVEAVELLETRNSGPFSHDALEADPWLEAFVNISLVTWKLATNSGTVKKLNDHVMHEVRYTPRDKHSMGAIYSFRDFTLIVPDRSCAIHLRYKWFPSHEGEIWGFKAETFGAPGLFYRHELDPNVAFQRLQGFVQDSLGSKAEI